MTLLVIQLLGIALIVVLTVVTLAVLILLSALFVLSKAITWPVTALLEKRTKVDDRKSPSPPALSGVRHLF